MHARDGALRVPDAVLHKERLRLLIVAVEARLGWFKVLPLKRLAWYPRYLTSR